MLFIISVKGLRETHEKRKKKQHEKQQREKREKQKKQQTGFFLNWLIFSVNIHFSSFITGDRSDKTLCDYSGGSRFSPVLHLT